MRAVLQRVSSAQVAIAEAIVGNIGSGWLVLLGVAPSDTADDARWMAEKIAGLRAFPDSDGKMNLYVQEIAGAILCISNFTLYADCAKGRRPSFIGAAAPEVAAPLYSLTIEVFRSLGIPTEIGQFGTDMQVSLVNDGPVTLILDSPKRI